LLDGGGLQTDTRARIGYLVKGDEMKRMAVFLGLKVLELPALILIIWGIGWLENNASYLLFPIVMAPPTIVFLYFNWMIAGEIVNGKKEEGE